MQEGNMRLLIVVRHGNYDDEYNLSPKGREQMQKLAESLQSLTNGNKVLLLSSTAKRASQSAEVISQMLSVSFEEHEILWSENCHPENKPSLLEFVRARKQEAEIVILITHLEYADSFPAYFAREELKINLGNTWPPEPEKGQACLIDCISKSFQLLP